MARCVLRQILGNSYYLFPAAREKVAYFETLDRHQFHQQTTDAFVWPKVAQSRNSKFIAVQCTALMVERMRIHH